MLRTGNKKDSSVDHQWNVKSGDYIFFKYFSEHVLTWHLWLFNIMHIHIGKNSIIDLGNELLDQIQTFKAEYPRTIMSRDSSRPILDINY